MAVIELVEALTVAQQATGEAEAATKRAAKDAAGGRGRRGPSKKDEAAEADRGSGRGVQGRG